MKYGYLTIRFSITSLLSGDKMRIRSYNICGKQTYIIAEGPVKGDTRMGRNSQVLNTRGWPQRTNNSEIVYEHESKRNPTVN
jgi:hypothetical protein